MPCPLSSLSSLRSVVVDPREPNRFAARCGDRELGRFTLDGLHGHARGHALAAAIGGPRQARFAGPLGVAHDLEVDAAHAGALLAAIVQRALGRLYGTVLVLDRDPRTAALWRALDVDVPPDLAIAAAGVAPMVGAIEPARADMLAMLRAHESGALRLLDAA